MPCTQCGKSVESGSRFCPHCGASVQASATNPGNASAPPYAGQTGGPYTSASPYASIRPTLQRPRSGRMIAGVCAAFANTYGWNVVLIRILLVVLTPLHLGLGFLAYVVGWIAIPEAPLTVPRQGTY